jgi:hypothetical protein
VNANYFIELRQRGERECIQRFFAALQDEAADQILDSLRGRFDDAVRTLTAAMEVVDINTDPRELADAGTPEELAAWRMIRPAIRTLDAVSAIASRFGPKSGSFAILDQLPLVDDLGLRDDVLMCTSTDIVRGSSTFRDAESARTQAVAMGDSNADIRICPWLRTTPKLNTIAEAKERQRAWAEAEWNALNAGRVTQRYTETGDLEKVIINNPYALEASAKS